MTDIPVGMFDGSLYFANTSYFEDKVLERVALRAGLRYMILVGDGINQIDANGEEMITHLAERLEKVGITLLFTGLKNRCWRFLSTPVCTPSSAPGASSAPTISRSITPGSKSATTMRPIAR